MHDAVLGDDQAAAAHAPSSRTARPRPRASLLLLAYLAFVSLGLPDGLIGVGWPSIRGDFSVPTEAVGFMLTAGTAGYLTASVVAGFTVARLGVGWLLAGSTALASVALAGYAVSPALAVMTGCALLLGLGSGAIDSGLNAYAAGAFGPRHMTWMHAFFGLGVALGPLIMTAALGANLAWRWGYGIVSAAQAVLAVAFLLTVRSWADRGGAPPDAGPAAPRPRIVETLSLPAVWLSALALGVYVAVEVGAGLWGYLLLTEGRGVGATAAGLAIAGYWGSLFVGRVVQGLVAERLGSTQVLWGSLGGMAVGAAVVAVPGPGWLAAAGLAVIGFAAAPVFPLITLTTKDRVGAGHADRAIGVQIGAAGLGGAVLPAGIGVLLGRYGPEVLGPALTGLAVAMCLLYLAASRKPRHAQPDRDPRGQLS